MCSFPQTEPFFNDIKTPLTVIHRNAELLRRSELTAKQTEYTHYILKNTDRMEAYLQTLIGLTRVESGYSAHMRNVPAEDFVHELTDQINGLASAKQLAVSFRISELPQVIRIDPDLLNRAMMNLASNAVPLMSRLTAQKTACVFVSGTAGKD